MNTLIIILAQLPIIGEILFDHYRWRKGLDDKPISTYLRIAAFIILAFIFVILYHQDSYIRSLITGGLFAFGNHLLFFDYALNISRPGKHIFYHKEGEIWNAVPWYGELFIKAVIAWSTWIAFFHWEWIQGDYPTRLIEYFMF